ncbi:MAG: hypothetical protein M3Q63_01590 [bacterium]|nr:hypothetical protein [bacterium]
MTLSLQIVWLFILAIPVACIAWTVTHEELLSEPRDYAIRKSIKSRSAIVRKFFYVFTCEYCFSHYVTIAILYITQYTLLFTDWRGYVIAGFALVWIANIYMNLYALIRVDIRKERLEANYIEQEMK